jgi:hypothetical protein
MEDKNIADWMNTSDPSQQKAIVDDIAGSMHGPFDSEVDLV